jgi:phospholipid/cholesterol/gamma-HCH transport system substrate-binding protein
VLPFVKEAARILEKQVRPFARTAQPFQRDLGAASRDLSKATPDLTTAFHELNRLFDIGAYNPGGTEGISEGCEKGGACTLEERARNEGYLYWLAWVGQNTVSLFSTADALGPIRRAYLLNLNCAAFTTGAREAGMGDAEADGLADLFGALGACSAP